MKDTERFHPRPGAGVRLGMCRPIPDNLDPDCSVASDLLFREEPYEEEDEEDEEDDNGDGEEDGDEDEEDGDGYSE